MTIEEIPENLNFPNCPPRPASDGAERVLGDARTRPEHKLSARFMQLGYSMREAGKLASMTATTNALAAALAMSYEACRLAYPEVELPDPQELPWPMMSTKRGSMVAFFYAD